MISLEYENFLKRKAVRAPQVGINSVPRLAGHLFDFQRHCVEFALRAGRAGIFLDTGMGKTEIQLEWCSKVIDAAGGKALILTPLAVAGQTKRRADRWGYEARVIRSQDDVGPGINICNYDRLDRLDPSQFSAVSLDEASILKSFEGKTRNVLISAFAGCQFRLAATATPAPNDHMEIGNYGEFLGVMHLREMLTRFFINDTSTASQQWRLKGHAVSSFWDWMSSWARMAEFPSDLGGDDDGFVLSPFEVVRHRARDSRISDDLADLFGRPRLGIGSVHDIKRQTCQARAEVVAGVVAGEPDKAWVIWVDTDYEADAVRRAVPSAAEVRGSQTADEKEAKLEAFGRGDAKVLVAKPSMCGFGLDWSHCDRMIFVGRSYSYETWYQAVRRCWRFGQRGKVVVHLVVAEAENEIGVVIDRKAGDHSAMKKAMRSAMLRAIGKHEQVMVPYNPKHTTRLAPWISAA